MSSSLQQTQAGLSASRDEITWVTTSYLIAEVVIIPLTRWLTRAFSTRFLVAIAAGGVMMITRIAWRVARGAWRVARGAR